MKKLILGKINNCGTLYYWELKETMKPSVGDYAIVENMEGYDLVKIVAIMETTDELSKLISKKSLKKVIGTVSKKEVEDDNNE